LPEIYERKVAAPDAMSGAAAEHLGSMLSESERSAAQGRFGAVRNAVSAIISTISAAETRNHTSLTIGAGFLC
jgi:hypothetical protein